MRLYFQASSRRPVGYLVGDLMQICDAFGGAARRVKLDGKRVPNTELAKLAASSARGDCELVYEWGALNAAWRYGPKSWGQSVDMGIASDRPRLAEVGALFTEICIAISADYAFADLEPAVQRESDAALERKLSLTPSDAFFTLFWYNFFGAPYSTELPLNGVVRECAYDVAELGRGGMVVQLREFPDKPADPTKLETLVREWPVFRKHSAASRFRQPVELDYSEVRSLSGPPSPEPGRIERPVGDVDAFIASAPTLAKQFIDWLGERGSDTSSEDALLEAIWLHADDIGGDDELFRGVCAAYGEKVRLRIGGFWAKAIVGNAEEPIIRKAWRPWKWPVVSHVIEAMDAPREEDL